MRALTRVKPSTTRAASSRSQTPSSLSVVSVVITTLIWASLPHCQSCLHNCPYMDIFSQPDTIFIVSHVSIIALIWASLPSQRPSSLSVVSVIIIALIWTSSPVGHHPHYQLFHLNCPYMEIFAVSDNKSVMSVITSDM